MISALSTVKSNTSQKLTAVSDEVAVRLSATFFLLLVPYSEIQVPLWHARGVRGFAILYILSKLYREEKGTATPSLPSGAGLLTILF